MEQQEEKRSQQVNSHTRRIAQDREIQEEKGETEAEEKVGRDGNSST